MRVKAFTIPERNGLQLLRQELHKNSMKGSGRMRHQVDKQFTSPLDRYTVMRNSRRFLIVGYTLAATVFSTTAFALAADLTGRVPARGSRTHYVYVGRSDDFITVDGDGDTDLDCWVYDEQNREVSSDTDNTDYCVLETPGMGRHRLVIRNLGTVYNEYVVSQQ